MQAHELLKKNMEHAQKLAQVSNVVFKMYQQQVKMLEDHHTTMAECQAAMYIQWLKKLSQCLNTFM